MMNKDRVLKILVFIALAAILFVNNGRISLWDQDEAAYAGFAKRMIETHNYVVPDFTWSFPHRKPPLHFWLITVAYHIFGVNEFAVRFFVALSLLGVYLMIYFFGRKFIGDKAAFYSAIVLGTSFFAPMLGKVAVTDGLLLFFHTLAGFSLLYVLEERRWIYVFWFYVAVAGGLLVKGPPILIFTGLFVILLFALHPKRMNLIILHPWFFGWFALAPLLIWGYKAWQQNPDFIRWMIDWYILRRATSDVFGQTGPVGYYLATITIFFSSYFVFFPAALKNSISALWKKPRAQWFLIGAWMVSGWFIYEFLKSKLPAYVIAAYPAVAMAIGYQMINSEKDQQDFKLLRYSAIFHLIITLAFVAGIAYLGREFFSHSYYGQAMGIAVLYLMLTIYGLTQIWTGKISIGNKILMINAGIFLFLIFASILPRLDYLRNAPRQVAEYVQDYADKNSVIVVANKFGDPPSLPFYLETKMPAAKLLYTQNIKQIDSVYNNSSACVLILSHKQLETIEKKHPQIKAHHIETMAIDRPGKLSYFVVIKHSYSQK